LVLLDPCAGDGEAIDALRALWYEDCEDLRPKILACEMEKERAAACQRKLHGRGRCIEGDAFSLAWDSRYEGAHVLHLNPPYDQDREHKRLEERFLERFTQALAPGGVLLFIVPATSLPASARTLALHYRDHRCWKFPEPEFTDYSQVAFYARRRRSPCRSEETRVEAEALIASWADPDHLWPLPEKIQNPLRVQLTDTFDRDLRAGLEGCKILQADLRATIDAWTPPTGIGPGLSLDDLIGRSYTTAMPPRPAHLALAVASGVFNGHRLEPNDPDRYPSLLLKGRFSRESVEIKAGESSSTRVEEPRLSLCALRLDTYNYFSPVPGAAPSGAEVLEEMNAADILACYSDGLADLMRRQFPPLHSPAEPDDRIELPPTARPAYRCQVHAIQATLKIAAAGSGLENVFVVAEVGTGKSQVTLEVANALSADNRAATVAQLQSLGFDRAGELPTVRRMLVQCPPHLVSSWLDQAAAVLPGWRAIEVTSISDLEADAEIYILSREKAKLGSTVEPLSVDHCPRCGAGLPKEAVVCARRRLRCTATTLRPQNAEAVDVERLSVAARGLIPTDETVRAVVEGFRHLGKQKSVTPDSSTVAGVLRRTLATVTGLLVKESLDVYGELYPRLAIVKSLARFLGSSDPVGVELRGMGGVEHGHGQRVQMIRSAALEMTGCSIGHGPFASAPATGPPGAGEDLSKALDLLWNLASWSESEPCDEMLHAISGPRRYPLSKAIVRRYPERFDLFALDEAHENNNQGSAQSKSAQRLLALGKLTLLLSGSFMGGYASSLFANLWAASARFRETFDRGDVAAFVDRYGYRKTLYEPREGVKVEDVDFGSQSDRETSCRARRLGEAPGILPAFLMDHLLPIAATIHKTDLEEELPPMSELRHPLDLDTDLDREIMEEYRRLETELLSAIKRDMFTPLQGKLLGQLLELPSYLDRCTDDQPEFVIAYTDGCDIEDPVLAVGRQFPASIRTPKERFLVESLRESLAAGDRTMVFLRHTGTAHLAHRLRSMLRKELGVKVEWLNAGSVSARTREAWIDQHINGPECSVMLVNPVAVRTGLNNLVSFCRTLWYESDYSAFTYRQANGRIHRIGQDRPCTVDWPYYPGTAQQAALELIAAKVTASLQLDGLSIQGALEACGADPESQAAAATSLAVGEAIYRALTARAA